MKRETAKKIIETFSDDELRDAGLSRFAENREFMEHYANGGNISKQGLVLSNPKFKPSTKGYVMEKPENYSCMCGDKTDGCGGKVTYENQACIPLDGTVRCIDWCIHHIVSALNAGGVKTVACCCGHGEQDGLITLADGRELVIRRVSK